MKKGGLYQIPKDHYKKIIYLLNLPKDVANKIPTSNGEFSLNQWKRVNDFFKEGKIDLENIEPSKLSYNSVQANQIKNTLAVEKQELSKKNEVSKGLSYEKSLPSLKEGIKVSVVSGAIEGGLDFYMSIVKKRKTGKKINDFDLNDWKDIAGGLTKAFFRGNLRGTTIYTLTNYTATPAAVANSIFTASIAVAEQVNLFRQGNLSEL